jgi:DNA-directed RNA polymerase sigma subunit (sigma70/sigma32)
MSAHLHDDDSLAEALADAWIERAVSDAKLRRLALRAAGLAKEPAAMSAAELAAEHGLTERRLRQIQADLLTRFRHDPNWLRILRDLYSAPPSEL